MPSDSLRPDNPKHAKPFRLADLQKPRRNGIDITRRSIIYEGQEYFVRIGAYSKGQMALRFEIKNAEAFKPGVVTSSVKPIRVTWNLGNYIGRERPMPKRCSFLNTPEFPGIEDLVMSTGIAKPVLRNGEQVVRQHRANNYYYPAFEFIESKLRILDPDGYERYSQSYDRQAAEEEKMKVARLSRRHGSCPQLETYDEVILDDVQF